MTRPRIVVLADGAVGLRTVEFLLSRPQPLVVGVGTVSSGSMIRAAAQSGGSTRLLPFADEERASFLSELALLRPDIVLAAWWPLILRDELGFGQRLTLNMHPSLLPHSRGKDPNFWSLADSEPFGATLHHVVREVDSGPIAFQKVIPYDWTDTGASLYGKACEAVVDLLTTHYDDIVSYRVPSIRQEPNTGSRHFRRELDQRSTMYLDDETTVRKLLTLLRARTFPPHPGCRFVGDDGSTYEVRIEISRVAG